MGQCKQLQLVDLQLSGLRRLLVLHVRDDTFVVVAERDTEHSDILMNRSHWQVEAKRVRKEDRAWRCRPALRASDDTANRARARARARAARCELADKEGLDHDTK